LCVRFTSFISPFLSTDEGLKDGISVGDTEGTVGVGTTGGKLLGADIEIASSMRYERGKHKRHASTK